MKYRLKNRELQRQLDVISEGLFTKTLESETTKIAREFDLNGNDARYRINLGEKTIYSVLIHIDDVEISPEYDPFSWNSFPEITPPEGVWMRCERPNDLCADGIERMCMKWMVDEQGGFWTDDCESGDFDYENLRFRPWED